MSKLLSDNCNDSRLLLLASFLIHFPNWNISGHTNNLSDIKTIHLNIKVLKTPSLDNQVQRPDWLDCVCGKNRPDFGQNNPFTVKWTKNCVFTGQITNRKEVINCSCFGTTPGFLRKWALKKWTKFRNPKTKDRNYRPINIRVEFKWIKSW